ncbi:hypothetical protein Pla144_11540 [Bythopirellula polymerisocia]|uniref:Uncharacterized protein n=1 Tax=Bythopirellula polymerisocia TaxID=2528003 RepID=A0A5C6D0W7_9BACT|nr:hypothetical protein Pla144_11540 [Bythopirellula polymerisocia]
MRVQIGQKTANKSLFCPICSHNNRSLKPRSPRCRRTLSAELDTRGLARDTRQIGACYWAKLGCFGSLLRRGLDLGSCGQIGGQFVRCSCSGHPSSSWFATGPSGERPWPPDSHTPSEHSWHASWSAQPYEVVSDRAPQPGPSEPALKTTTVLKHT